MKIPKTVIFDMDGVLLNSEPLYFEVESKLYKEFDLPVSREEHNGFVGMSMRKIWETLKASYNLSNAVEDLIEIHIEKMMQQVKNQQNLQPSSGIRELLSEIKKNDGKIAVATSTARKLAVVTLEKIGLKGEFDVIVCGDEIEQGKPAPDIFLKAAQLLSASPNHCVVIEDSTNGVKAAKRAGMSCIGYKNPGSGEQDLTLADYVTNDFRELNWEKIVSVINRDMPVKNS